MPLTRIPERYEPGLATIISLGDDKFTQLAKAIDMTRPLSGFNDFTEAVRSQLGEWKSSDVFGVLRTLYSLSPYLADGQMTPEDLASQLLKVMRTSSKDRLQVPEGSQTQFLGRLTHLLGTDSIRLASKAFGLKQDHERRFCDVRIITDIRPVFADVHEMPTRVIVSHMLQIGYHEHGDHKEFFVALDEDDLIDLKKSIERAEVKQTSIGNLLAASGVKEFDHS